MEHQPSCSQARPNRIFSLSGHMQLPSTVQYPIPLHTCHKMSANVCFFESSTPQNRCTHTCSCTYILARRQLWLQYLLGGRVYWACRKRTVETAMLVCAYTRALHAPGDGIGTTSERHSPTIRQTQIDYKKTQPRGLPAMSGTIVQALSMLTFVASPESVALTLP